MYLSIKKYEIQEKLRLRRKALINTMGFFCKKDRSTVWRPKTMTTLRKNLINYVAFLLSNLISEWTKGPLRISLEWESLSLKGVPFFLQARVLSLTVYFAINTFIKQPLLPQHEYRTKHRMLHKTAANHFSFIMQPETLHVLSALLQEQILVIGTSLTTQVMAFFT